jgi:hypothetical protein
MPQKSFAWNLPRGIPSGCSLRGRIGRHVYHQVGHAAGIPMELGRAKGEWAERDKKREKRKERRGNEAIIKEENPRE